MSATSNLSVKGARKETNGLGEVDVPSSKLWSAQTPRSLKHFSIEQDRISREMLAAYATLEKAAARRRFFMSQKGGAVKRGQQSEVRLHQLGQEVFKTILSEDVDWKPFPAFPPSVRLAVVVGQPSQPGPYTIRVKTPHGEKLMPHKHPEDRVYTVISGVFYIGLGDEFDASKLEAYPPGAVIILPGNTHHFHWAKSGEYVTQITAMGPLGLEYLSAKDDPRNAR
jgi:quercetin dioxygenase-like cupin family protein